jgi:hypothetical protein
MRSVHNRGLLIIRLATLRSRVGPRIGHLAITIVSCTQLIDTSVLEITSNKYYNPPLPGWAMRWQGQNGGRPSSGRALSFFSSPGTKITCDGVGARCYSRNYRTVTTLAMVWACDGVGARTKLQDRDNARNYRTRTTLSTKEPWQRSQLKNHGNARNSRNHKIRATLSTKGPWQRSQPQGQPSARTAAAAPASC